MAEVGQRGGILDLVRLDRETGGALTADMMERLGCTMAGAPLVYGWHAVHVWSRHLPQGSAVWRAMHREEGAFSSPYGLALLAADIFDAVMVAGRNAAESNGATFRSQLKLHPRPGKKDDGGHFGSGAIPVGEFDAWYYGT